MTTTTFIPAIGRNYAGRVAKPSFLSIFVNWCKNQQNNNLLWVGISLAGHGCILTPLTVLAVLQTGPNLLLITAAMVAMAMSLISALAALPTRITIPVFFLTILIDLGIIIASFAS